MNRNNLLSLIILDLLVLALAAGFIAFRYRSITAAITSPTPMMSRTALPAKPALLQASETFAPAPRKTVAPAAEARPPLPPKTAAKETALPAKETRNIGFSYRSSKAKIVEIIGDFNAWVPKPFIRGADFRWTLSLPLKPGEYAYNFVVDGKPMRDPNNPRMCDVGRGYPNSYLSVKPFSHEKQKK